MKRSRVIETLLFAPAVLFAESMDLYRFEVPREIPAPKEGLLKIGPSNPDGPVWGCTSRYMTRDGKPLMPVMGEFHFSRYPAAEWDEALGKIKAGGVDIVATYLFWIYHEEEEGVFDFSGQRDIRRFVELCQKHDLSVWIRLGPWCHGEVRNGGFPEWLRKPFHVAKNEHLGRASSDGLRSNNPEYLKLVDRLYAAYGEQCTGLMAKDGGPVIGVQVENEYSKTGPGMGAEHIAKLIELAKKHGFDVPYFSVTGWHNAPFPEKECLPMFGGYPAAPWNGTVNKLAPRSVYRFDLQRDAGGIGTDLFATSVQDSKRDLSPYPLMTCEIGVGNQVTGHRRPWVTTLDGVIPPFTRLGIGAGSIGYYVYHGGTNPDGRFTTLQESKATAYPNDCPVKSYDFEAAIRESGRIDEKYHYLKQMHMFIHDFGSLLAPTVALLPDPSPESNEDFGPARMALRTDGKTGFLFVNNHVRGYPQPERENVQVVIKMGKQKIPLPAEPVTIPSSAYFIWPVNLQMEDAVLQYATAQPLCILQNGRNKTYVFAQTITEKPEYVFDPETVQGNTKRFVVDPGIDSMLEVADRSGSRLRILTLTKEQALRAYKYDRGGMQHLVISDADAVFENDGMELFTMDTLPVKLKVYPELDLSGAGIISKGRIGSFDVYSVIPATVKVQLPVVTSAGENQWKINTGKLPKGSRLRITYTGDVAELYLGDRLVYDNFYNGEVFEVGLDRFADELKENPLTLKISPLKDSRKVYLDVPRPDGIPAVAAVDLVVEKRIPIAVGQ